MSIVLVTRAEVKNKYGLEIEKYLASGELLQYNKYQTPRKLDWLAGRLALKKALIGTDLTPGSRFLYQFSVNNLSSGIPYSPQYPHFHCSLAHSYGWGVGVAAPWKVGVDIEKVRPHKKSLLDYVATFGEIDLVEEFEPKTDIITLIWTIKEAVMKALGSGFRISPRQVIVKSKNENGAFEVESLLDTAVCWNVWSFMIESYCVSVAYEKKHGQKTSVDWDSKIGISSANA